jgi:hypothetical protein
MSKFQERYKLSKLILKRNGKICGLFGIFCRGFDYLFIWGGVVWLAGWVFLFVGLVSWVFLLLFSETGSHYAGLPLPFKAGMTDTRHYQLK